MNPRLTTFGMLRIIIVAVAVAYLYLFCFRESYALLAAHFQSKGDTRVYLKLLWALVFTFAIYRNFQKIGLQLPRRDSLGWAVVAPIALVLISYYAIGYYLEWNGFLFQHNVCVAVAEEVFFNGCLIALLRPLGIRNSAYISGIIFSTFHFGTFPDDWFNIGALQTGTTIFAMSIFITGVRYYSGSLLPGMVVHFLLDYLINFYPASWAMQVTQFGFSVWEGIVLAVFLSYGIVLLFMSEKREAGDPERGKTFFRS